MLELILFILIAICVAIMLLCRYVLRSTSPRFTDHPKSPWYLGYARSLFPVLLAVFVIRGFIAEPFRIPSGSMLPTLEIGDFILVNKFIYGIRLPVIHTKILPLSSPQRGEIMVFRYPHDNKTHYIKRVIGLPGDRVEYRHKRLYINGTEVPAVATGSYTLAWLTRRQRALQRYTQTIPANAATAETSTYSILLEPRSASPPQQLVIPEGQYFVLGDNRDHSQDSRFWGLVPEPNVVGKAFFIWFHWNHHPEGGIKWSRVGTDIYSTL